MRRKQDFPFHSEKRVAILSYKHICRFLVSEFEKCYGSNSNYTVEQKDAWIGLTQAKQQMFDGELTHLTKAGKVLTSAYTSRIAQPKTDLTHNKHQPKKAVKAILELLYLAQLKLDFFNLGDNEVSAKY